MNVLNHESLRLFCNRRVFDWFCVENKQQLFFCRFLSILLINNGYGLSFLCFFSVMDFCFLFEHQVRWICFLSFFFALLMPYWIPYCYHRSPVFQAPTIYNRWNFVLFKEYNQWNFLQSLISSIVRMFCDLSFWNCIGWCKTMVVLRIGIYRVVFACSSTDCWTQNSEWLFPAFFFLNYKPLLALKHAYEVNSILRIEISFLMMIASRAPRVFFFLLSFALSFYLWPVTPTWLLLLRNQRPAAPSSKPWTSLKAQEIPLPNPDRILAAIHPFFVPWWTNFMIPWWPWKKRCTSRRKGSPCVCWGIATLLVRPWRNFLRFPSLAASPKQ